MPRRAVRPATIVLFLLLLLNIPVVAVFAGRLPDLSPVVSLGLLIGGLDVLWVLYRGSDSILLDTILVGAVLLSRGIEWAALVRFVSFLVVMPIAISRSIDPLLYASGVPLVLVAGFVYRLVGGAFGSLNTPTDLAAALATAVVLGLLTPLPHLAVGGDHAPSSLATGLQTFVLRVIRQAPAKYLAIGALGILTALVGLHVSPAAGLTTGVLLALLAEYQTSKARLLVRTHRKALALLMSIVEARDPYTRGHSERVAAYTVALGRQMGIPPWRWDRLYEAGLLHDLGKLVVPEEIVLKPGPLTSEELRLVQRHAAAGAELLTGFGPNDGLAAAVRHHHERYAGGGYPDGLVGNRIPHLSRIITVADSFDAMTSTRPYRSALTVDQALAEIRGGSGRQFDPEVVAAAAVLQAGAQAAQDLAQEVTGEAPTAPATEIDDRLSGLDGLQRLQMTLEALLASGRRFHDPEVRELADRIDRATGERIELLGLAKAQTASTSEEK